MHAAACYSHALHWCQGEAEPTKPTHITPGVSSCGIGTALPSLDFCHCLFCRRWQLTTLTHDAELGSWAGLDHKPAAARINAQKLLNTCPLDWMPVNCLSTHELLALDVEQPCDTLRHRCSAPMPWHHGVSSGGSWARHVSCYWRRAAERGSCCSSYTRNRRPL